MHTNQFKYLCAIAETKSINAAADKLFISHQALSKAMKKLETELSCTIFARTSKGIEFTDDGEFVLSIAKKVDLAIDELESHFKIDHNTLSGALNYLSSPYPYRSNLLPTLRHFRNNYPNVKLNGLVCENPVIVEKLDNHEAEFAIINFFEIDEQYILAFPPNLIFHETARFKMVAVFRCSYPLARYKKPSLKTLCRYPVVILPSSDDFAQSSSMLLLKKFCISKVIEANSSQGFLQFLEDNLGWGLIPDYTLPTLPESLVVRPIKEHIYTVDGYLLNKSYPLSALEQMFIEYFERHPQ